MSAFEPFRRAVIADGTDGQRPFESRTDALRQYSTTETFSFPKQGRKTAIEPMPMHQCDGSSGSDALGDIKRALCRQAIAVAAPLHGRLKSELVRVHARRGVRQ